MPNLTCPICSTVFYAKPSHAKWRRFCSKQCGGKWHATTRLAERWKQVKASEPKLFCAGCGTKVEKAPKTALRTKRHFCSKACHIATQRAERAAKQAAEKAQRDAEAEAKARKCLHCSKKLKRRPVTKYCGPECRRAFMGQSSMTVVNCVDCGKPRKASQHYVYVRCRPCAEANRKGENNSNWRGGRKSATAKFRASPEYAAWRTSVFERDSYTCQWCGQVGGVLNADHIKPFAFHPELRLDIGNGRTLCVPCHKKTPTYLSKALRYGKLLHQTQLFPELADPEKRSA